MECNRDEAERAKEIAEKKLLAKDVAGAKKFATKAQSLYPRTNGISQLLATIDVFIHADNKINGQVDWYGVLGVNPLDTEDVIRKQYRKLVLMLHPDKNKSNGANGAFLLVAEAWELLSDKTKRSAYDRITSPSQHNVQPQCHGSAKPAPDKNGFPNSNDCPKPPNGPPPSSHKQKPANASAPPPHEYRPGTVPPSSYKHDRRTAPPFPSYKERSSTFPRSPKHKPTKMPGSYHKRQNPPQKPQQTASFLSACRECKNQYYCPIIYINQDLLCRDCFNEAFHGRKPC